LDHSLKMAPLSREKINKIIDLSVCNRVKSLIYIELRQQNTSQSVYPNDHSLSISHRFQHLLFGHYLNIKINFKNY
jgi:hypothetical protein